jgi:hypothetical protein
MPKYKPPFTVFHVDHGFGRIVFSGKNSQGQTIFYGICQEDSNTFQLYRLCQQWEPQNVARSEVPLTALFELPRGESLLEQDIRAFIISSSLEKRLKEINYEV